MMYPRFAAGSFARWSAGASMALGLLAGVGAPAHAFGLAEEDSSFLPGLYYFHKGCDYFRRGDQRVAVQMWEIAAGWAVKDAQYDLGIAYIRGLGVPVDKPRGLAWLALAAERKDETFESGLASAWAQASPAERSAANAIWRELKKTYADAVALRRAERHYQQELASLTGSRVGTSGNVTIWTRSTERLGLSTFKQEMQRKADLAFGRLPKGSVIVEPLVPVGTEKSQ